MKRGNGVIPAVVREFRVSVVDGLWFVIQASQKHWNHEIHEMARKTARALSFATSAAARHEGRVESREGSREKRG